MVWTFHFEILLVDFVEGFFDYIVLLSWEYTIAVTI